MQIQIYWKKETSNQEKEHRPALKYYQQLCNSKIQIYWKKETSNQEKEHRPALKHRPALPATVQLKNIDLLKRKHLTKEQLCNSKIQIYWKKETTKEKEHRPALKYYQQLCNSKIQIYWKKETSNQEKEHRKYYQQLCNSKIKTETSILPATVEFKNMNIEETYIKILPATVQLKNIDLLEKGNI